jgi:hypothetical protein
MAPGGRRVKRESTIAFGGLVTPDDSLYSAGTTPKREFSSVSDVLEDPYQGIVQQDGLPADEGYSSMVVEQQRRSGTSSESEPSSQPVLIHSHF